MNDAKLHTHTCVCVCVREGLRQKENDIQIFMYYLQNNVRKINDKLEKIILPDALDFRILLSRNQITQYLTNVDLFVKYFSDCASSLEKYVEVDFKMMQFCLHKRKEMHFKGLVMTTDNRSYMKIY